MFIFHVFTYHSISAFPDFQHDVQECFAADARLTRTQPKELLVKCGTGALFLFNSSFSHSLILSPFHTLWPTPEKRHTHPQNGSTTCWPDHRPHDGSPTGEAAAIGLSPPSLFLPFPHHSLTQTWQAPSTVLQNRQMNESGCVQQGRRHNVNWGRSTK